MDGDIDEMLFCPIKAIKKYLIRAEQYHPTCSSLIVSMTKRKKQVAQNPFSFWIRLVIGYAYKSTTNEDCRGVKVKSCEVCETGITLLLRKNYVVQQVLKAGT